MRSRCSRSRIWSTLVRISDCGQGALAAYHSVPAPPTVKAAATNNEQHDEDDQKCVSIHRRLLGEIEQTSRLPVLTSTREGQGRKVLTSLRGVFGRAYHEFGAAKSWKLNAGARGLVGGMKGASVSVIKWRAKAT